MDFREKLYDAIENNYRYNPDTLMPLLMISLAVQGKLRSSTKHSDNHIILCKINLRDVVNYDWVRLDPFLKNRIKTIVDSGADMLCIEGVVDKSLKDIYYTFYEYDNETVKEEYHYRTGRLPHHSSNKSSEEAHRQYAAINLAEILIDLPNEWLVQHFIDVYNHILVRSGLQPERPRLAVAFTLNTLLKYDGVGKVYNPFAGCAIAAATIPAGENMYADGTPNTKLFAVACLLNYSMGGSNLHFKQRDSTNWINGVEFDYVISTYRGYIGKKSAFDFCLSRCFDTFTEGGKYAGIVSPKDIFETQTPEFKEALRRDWVETIVLLPFGEVAVLVNSRKAKSLKSKVRFYDLTHPMLACRPVQNVLQDDTYVQILRISDVRKKGYLRSLVVHEIKEKEGYKIIRLGDIVRKLRRQTFSLKKVRERSRVIVTVNRKMSYRIHVTENGLEKSPISSLFAPAYHLKRDSLITNISGELEPRIFDAFNGDAYFQDGYAFEFRQDVDQDVDWQWLIEELNEPYVQNQLHPYGMDKMVLETMTEDQILNLKLYQELEDNDYATSNQFDIHTNKLPNGFELTCDNVVYTIHKFLDNGYFGYVYIALAKSLVTGEEREVVLKEFYPHMYVHREGVDCKVVANNQDHCLTGIDIRVEKEKFFKEAKIMRQLGDIPDSHIMPAAESFNCEKTGTAYYVMPYYSKGSLADPHNSGMSFTEDMLLNHIVKPLCKALHLAHTQKPRILHLDIKPENILLDNNGNAVLADFGGAKQYNTDGQIDSYLDKISTHGTNKFAAPEMSANYPMTRFSSEPDIYALAAVVYYLATGKKPFPVQYNSEDDVELRYWMKEVNMSEKFIEAIVAGMQAIPTLRPRNAQAFLNLFPGFESVEF